MNQDPKFLKLSSFKCKPMVTVIFFNFLPANCERKYYFFSMLKEQLGSVSETEHKTLPVMENVRPPTSCADIGTQCDTIDNENNNAQDIITNIGQHQDEIDDRIDNPLSDTSTWNTELPNIGKLLKYLDIQTEGLNITIEKLPLHC